ncbi:hypothetical protein SSX86_030032 [Deinandra increscens subsp. villosa]|uniref:Protein kinase domain-containing protein n=1 Tax=Deinandra increscens subsp. villosa TaxID=3103831 RepID=A0AAP0GKM2_9ASTR
MWAMGAIMAELFTLRPLFPGSSEADEIYKICSVIGSPTESSWAEGLELASTINYLFPVQRGGVNLSALIPSASKDAVNLIASLCSWDPCKRPTASEALQHPFFQSCYYVAPSLRPKSNTIARTPPSAVLNGRRAVDQKCAKKYPGSLPNSKPAGNVTSFSKVHASLNPDGAKLTSLLELKHKWWCQMEKEKEQLPLGNGETERSLMELKVR